MSRERRGLRLARALARELATQRTSERRRDTCTWTEAERWTATIQYEDAVRTSGGRSKTGRTILDELDPAEPEHDQGRDDDLEADERA